MGILDRFRLDGKRAVVTGASRGLGRSMALALADVGADVAAVAGAAGLVVVDGPLRERHRVPGAVGYVKRHEAGYGTPVVSATVDRLAPGERTPVFLVGERFRRYSWYVRLPTSAAASHPFAATVRCELAPDRPVAAAVEVADRVTAMLPRFASGSHKDPRAPQNLIPIAGLERRLRGMLGDSRLLLRSLTAAARATAA